MTMRAAPRLLVCACLVASLAVRAQAQDVLRTRLDQATYEALGPVFDAARRDSVPLRALESKALEGVAKRRPSAQILVAVRRLASELRDARVVLRRAAPALQLSEGEIVAAADAIRQGVPPDDVATLRRDAPPAAVLEIPLAVFGALVARGVPAPEARDVIAHLLATEVPQARMVEIPERVDVAIRVGAPPVVALGSALQGLGIPRPPVVPRGRRRQGLVPAP